MAGARLPPPESAREGYVSLPFKALIALSGRALATAAKLEDADNGGVSSVASGAAADRVSPSGGLPCVSSAALRACGEPERTCDAKEAAACLRRAVEGLAAGAADVALVSAARVAEIAEDDAMGCAHSCCAPGSGGDDWAQAWRDAAVLGRLIEDLLRQGEAGRLDAARRALDMAIIIGGPAWRAALDWAARGAVDGALAEGRDDKGTPPATPATPAVALDAAARRGEDLGGSARFAATAGLREVLPPGSLLAARAVPCRMAAELDDGDAFAREHLLPAKAVVLKGAVAHWSWAAAERWAKPGGNYLKRVAGGRLVPVEVCRARMLSATRAHAFLKIRGGRGKGHG